MKFRLSGYLISKLLIVIFLLLISFILGISVTKTTDFEPIEQTKINVSNLLVHPETAEFKNMVYYFNKKIRNGGELGYICGEVFTLDDEKLSGSFKRFIVKVYNPPKGITLLSFPIMEDGEEALLSERINEAWAMFCHKPE